MEKEKKKVLIVIDMQNDFVYGPLGTPEAQAIVPNVMEKIADYKRNNWPILYTRDTHYEDYLDTQEGKKLPVLHCIRDTEGWQIIPEINPYENCFIFDKNTFGKYNWELETWLDGKYARYDIEIIGVCLDICVISNALILKATFPENEITVDARCCAGSTPEKHKAALEVMKSCQINVIGELGELNK
jgi:nicotinamidase-related amidase